jgi:outer membrane protein assembly factor BamB
MPPRFSVLAAGLLLAAAARADWPQWRGPNRDGHSAGPLPAALPENAAPLWRIPAGHGYAGPVTSGDRLVYADEADGHETWHAVNRATGSELWRTALGPTFADEFEPGPRCTPVIDGDRVYGQTCKGEFRCVGLADGAVRWKFSFSDYGAPWSDDRNNGPGAAARRGNAGSPLIVGDSVVVQVGSDKGACLAAFDKKSGRLLWKSQNDLTCYSSPVLAQAGGVAQIVTATCEGLLAVQPAGGAELWRVRFKTAANRNVLTPVVDHDTVYFASFSTGLRATRITPAAGGGLRAEEAWFNPQLKIHLSTPVLAGGFLFGPGPAKSGTYACVSAADGRQVWSQPGFGDVASTITDGERLLIFAESGEVILADAKADGWKERGRFQGGGRSFSHPAYADGVLYVRDTRNVSAWKLK